MNRSIFFIGENKFWKISLNSELVEKIGANPIKSIFLRSKHFDQNQLLSTFGGRQPLGDPHITFDQF